MIGVQEEGRARLFFSAAHTNIPRRCWQNRVAVILELEVNSEVLSAPLVTHFLIFIQRKSSRCPVLFRGVWQQVLEYYTRPQMADCITASSTASDDTQPTHPVSLHHTCAEIGEPMQVKVAANLTHTSLEWEATSCLWCAAGSSSDSLVSIQKQSHVTRSYAFFQTVVFVQLL